MKLLHNILRSTPRYSFFSAAVFIIIQQICMHKSHCKGSGNLEIDSMYIY
jgi:hypothetical protein